MTNNHLLRSIQDADGNLVLGATVAIYAPGTTTLLTDTLYSDAALSTPLANPFPATSGYVDFYLATAQVVSVGITNGTNPEVRLDNLNVGVVLPPEAPPAYVLSIPVLTPGGVDTLVADSTAMEYFVEHDATITYVRASLGSSGDGQDVVLDIRANGTSIGATTGTDGQIHLPPDSSHAPQSVLVAPDHITTTALAAGTALSVAVIQVGTGAPGGYAVVQIGLQPTA